MAATTLTRWRGVVLETKQNVNIEARDYRHACSQMKKETGLPERDRSGKVNWVVGKTAGEPDHD